MHMKLQNWHAKHVRDKNDRHKSTSYTLFCNATICWARPRKLLGLLSRVWRLAVSPNSWDKTCQQKLSLYHTITIFKSKIDSIANLHKSCEDLSSMTCTLHIILWKVLGSWRYSKVNYEVWIIPGDLCQGVCVFRHESKVNCMPS